MILFDTETTKLVASKGVADKMQPRIVEIGCVKYTDGPAMKQVDTFESLVNPGTKIPPDATKIHGITDEMVREAPSFIEIYDELCTFFLGEVILGAHNNDYDTFVLGTELNRVGKRDRFPWPSYHICTVDAAYSIKGTRLSLSNLHQHLFGEEFPEAHRAIPDTLALGRCFKELVKQGYIELP